MATTTRTAPTNAPAARPIPLLLANHPLFVAATAHEKLALEADYRCLGMQCHEFVKGLGMFASAAEYLAEGWTLEGDTYTPNWSSGSLYVPAPVKAPKAPVVRMQQAPTTLATYTKPTKEQVAATLRTMFKDMDQDTVSWMECEDAVSRFKDGEYTLAKCEAVVKGAVAKQAAIDAKQAALERADELEAYAFELRRLYSGLDRVSQKAAVVACSQAVEKYLAGDVTLAQCEAGIKDMVSRAQAPAKPTVTVAKAAPVAPAPKAPETKAKTAPVVVKAAPVQAPKAPAPLNPAVVGNAMVAQWEAGKLSGQALQAGLRDLGLHMVEGKAVKLPPAKPDMPPAELRKRAEGKRVDTHAPKSEVLANVQKRDQKEAIKASGVDAKDKAAIKARTFQTLLAGIDAGTVTANDSRWDDVSADQLDTYFKAHKASGEYKGYSGLKKAEKVAYLVTGDRPEVEKKAPGPNTMAANLEWLRQTGGTQKGYSAAITALCKEFMRDDKASVSKLKAEKLREFVAYVKAHDAKQAA